MNIFSAKKAQKVSICGYSWAEQSWDNFSEYLLYNSLFLLTLNYCLLPTAYSLPWQKD
ncbi:MAG: hypothetical protein F6K17_25310 [Okeania sp. SIO3C4]|nr:hypothetical protein [Okeania sp. SIO3B3]NER05669.1 hypothetical protein [Okeania sp. SIO3C4]